MKKLALAAVAATLVFTACKKNDDNNNASIVGKWNATNFIKGKSVNGGAYTFDTTTYNNSEYVEFTQDGKFYGVDTANYTVTGNTLHFIYSDNSTEDLQILKLEDHALSVYETTTDTLGVGNVVTYQYWNNFTR